MSILFFLVFTLIFHFSQAQVTIEVLSLPENTPIEDSLFISGDFNNWDPSSTVLSKNKEGFYSVHLPEVIHEFSYKLTRGSWEKAEANAKGDFLENRKVRLFNDPQYIQISIESWEDQNSASSTAASNVQVLDENFALPQLDKRRRIWLYLPPDYKDSEKSYPVIYMHDGQNLFDKKTAYSGEWEVDENLNQLFKEGDYGAIVVGIDNGETARLDEYSPWKNPEYGGGEGKLYAEFIVKTLKPFIDSHFRTKIGAENTAMIGSSMGAFISTYIAVEYPETFGKIGSLSPAYWFALSDLEDCILQSDADLSNTKFYFIAGKNENDSIETDIDRIKKVLEKSGLKDFMVEIDPEGKHNEAYWKSIFNQVYQWLFDF